MASPSATLPPLDKLYIIGIWVETALWGVNTVGFAFVCFVLLSRRNSRSSKWFLGITSLLLYLCVTLHVAASLRQNIEAFVLVPPGAPPHYGSIYFLQVNGRMAVMKNALYIVAVFIQDSVLIWRMYVVWGSNWKITILPLVVEAVHTGCSIAALIGISHPNTHLTAIAMSTLSSLGWPLELVVNVSVTGAIVSIRKKDLYYRVDVAYIVGVAL